VSAHGATNKSHHVVRAAEMVKRPGLFQAKNDADAGRLFAAVEWYCSDRLLGATLLQHSFFLFLIQREMKNEKKDPDADCRVRDVEGGPMIAVDIEV
jgi:hypothetical protein